MSVEWVVSGTVPSIFADYTISRCYRHCFEDAIILGILRLGRLETCHRSLFTRVSQLRNIPRQLIDVAFGQSPIACTTCYQVKVFWSWRYCLLLAHNRVSIRVDLLVAGSDHVDFDALVRTGSHSLFLIKCFPISLFDFI